MSTINQMIQEYNTLAKRTGEAPLNSWKQDKLKLQSRIDRLKNNIQPKKLPIEAAAPMTFKPKRPLSKADELIEKEVARASDYTITVVDVAEEHNIDPKVARAKLRRKGLKSNEGRWPRFKRDSAEHKDMIKLLKGDTSANS